MPWTKLAALTFFLLPASMASADTSPVFHAGAWETSNDKGPVHRICEKKDHVFDRDTMAKIMAMTGSKCTPGDLSTVGPVTNYTTICDIEGGKLTVHSIITYKGPDSYTTRSISHLEGGTMKMPDMDMTQAAHRVGECQPGDKVSPF